MKVWHRYVNKFFFYYTITVYYEYYREQWHGIPKSPLGRFTRISNTTYGIVWQCMTCFYDGEIQIFASVSAPCICVYFVTDLKDLSSLCKNSTLKPIKRFSFHRPVFTVRPYSSDITLGVWRSSVSGCSVLIKCRISEISMLFDSFLHIKDDGWCCFSR